MPVNLLTKNKFCLYWIVAIRGAQNITSVGIAILYLFLKKMILQSNAVMLANAGMSGDVWSSNGSLQYFRSDRQKFGVFISDPELSSKKLFTNLRINIRNYESSYIETNSKVFFKSSAQLT